MFATLLLRRRLIPAGLFACALGLCMPAQASSVSWTVNGVFSNGGTLSGTFDFDAATTLTSNWNLTALGYTYTPADSTFSSGQCCSDQFDYMFSTEGDILTLDFAFNPDLTNAGGTSSIAGGAVTYFQGSGVPATVDPILSGKATSAGGIAPPPPVSPPPPPPVDPPPPPVVPPQPPPPVDPPPTATPEPASVGLLSGGLLLIALRFAARRKKNPSRI